MPNPVVHISGSGNFTVHIHGNVNDTDTTTAQKRYDEDEENQKYKVKYYELKARLRELKEKHERLQNDNAGLGEVDIVFANRLDINTQHDRPSSRQPIDGQDFHMGVGNERNRLSPRHAIDNRDCPMDIGNEQDRPPSRRAIDNREYPADDYRSNDEEGITISSRAQVATDEEAYVDDIIQINNFIPPNHQSERAHRTAVDDDDDVGIAQRTRADLELANGDLARVAAWLAAPNDGPEEHILENATTR